MMSNNNSHSNAKNPPIPIFLGENFEQWAEWMRRIFLEYGLWEYVENGYDESNWKMEVENIKNDAKALSYIKQGVSKKIYPRIKHATKAKQAWDTLVRDFEGNPQVPPPNFGSNAPPPPSYFGSNAPPPPLPNSGHNVTVPRGPFPPGSKRETALTTISVAGNLASIGSLAIKGYSALSGNNKDQALFATTHDPIKDSAGNPLFATTQDAMKDSAGNPLFATTQDAIGPDIDNNFATTQDTIGSTSDQTNQFQDIGTSASDDGSFWVDLADMLSSFLG